MPDEENYETLAGFMMFKLRKIPRPADIVLHAGYKFEVVDVDHFKIDQLLVTRMLEVKTTDRRIRITWFFFNF